MFEVEVSRIDPFRSLVKALSVIVEEGTFTMNEAQLKLLAMDPSHVAMVDFELPGGFFDSYRCEGEPKLSINIKEFLRFLDRVDRDEQVRIVLNTEKARLVIHCKRGGHSRRFEMPILEPLDEEVPQPKIFFKAKARGYVRLIRYCDDFVVACESEEDARRFLTAVGERFSGFGLSLSEEKTRIVSFGRRAWNQSRQAGRKAATFDFLGFTHYCTASRRGKFIVGHKTSKRSLARKLKETKEWLKRIRSMLALRDWWPVLRAKLRGHYSYFGISGNIRCLRQFYRVVHWMVFKWINRRSQKRSMTLAQYKQYLKWNPLPVPRIYHSIYTLSPSR